MNDNTDWSLEDWLALCRAPTRLSVWFDLPIADPAALFELMMPLIDAPDRGMLRVIHPPWWTPSNDWRHAQQVEVIALSTGEQEAVLAMMKQAASNDCLLIIDADRLSHSQMYPEKGTVQNGPAGQTTITEWHHIQCHRLALLIAAWRATPETRGAACILTSQHHMPTNEAFQLSVETGNCSVVHSTTALDVVSGVVERWGAALLAGAEPANVDAAIREMLPAGYDVEAAIGGAFYIAGDWDRAWSYLRAARSPDPIHLANVAHHLGRYEEACDLIVSVDPSALVDVNALGFARLLAIRLSLLDHADALADRLIELHPNSQPGLEIRSLRLICSNRWDELLDLVDQAPISTPALQYARHLAQLANLPDQSIDTFIREAKRLGGEFAEIAWLEAMRALLVHRTVADVARQLIACCQRVPRCQAALALIERIAVTDAWMSEPPLFSLLCQLMNIALTELAQAPLRGDLRMSLSGLFQPGRLGLETHAVLEALFRAPVRPPQLKAAREPHEEPTSREEVEAYLIRRIVENPNRLLRLDHQDILPVHARPAVPAAMLLGILRMIMQGADVGFQVLEEAQGGFLIMVHAALELIETAGGTLAGLDKPSVIGMAGQMAAINGYDQWALQLAEAALVVSRTDAQRRRHGWWVHADLHARVGHRVQALIAYLCCQRVKVAKVSPHWRLMELELRIRLARDWGLNDTVEEAYDESRQVRARHGLNDNYSSLDDAYWTSRLQALTMHTGDGGQGTARALLDYYERRLSVTYDAGSNIKVSLMNLWWTMEQARRFGIPIPAALQADFDRILGEMPAPDRRMIEALRGAIPTLDDLRIVIAPVARTRYGADLPTHLRRARMVASRLLAKRDAGFVEALVAVEVMADNAIARRDAEDQALGEIARLQARWLANPTMADKVPTFLREAAEAGATQAHAIYEFACNPEAEAAALLANLPATSTLVAIAIGWDGAVIRVVSPPGMVHRTPLTDLGARVERAFTALDVTAGFDATTATARIVEAMEPLALGEATTDEVVVLPSAELAMLPFNALPHNGVLLGARAPVTFVPSLCWLAVVAKRPPRAGRVAWVLPGDIASDGEPSALAWVADRIGPATAGHGFKIAAGPHPPAGTKTAGVAVVIAHGGLDLGQRLTRVSDERGDVSSADRFIKRLRGPDVVIALICHGGRQTPTAERPTGLPRMLLSDETRAVVACPWVLDARAAMAWLPLFLDEWARGLPLSKAVFQANSRLAESFPHPGDWLAMHVFGCPALTMPV